MENKMEMKKDLVIMTVEEHEFERSLMKSVGKADLIEELNQESGDYANYIKAVYLRELRAEIGLAVTEVQEATGDTVLRNAVEYLLDQLYKVGLADE